MKDATIDAALERAVSDGTFPAAELLVAKQGKILHHGYAGDARTGVCFDVASLTKPICTATLTMMLAAEELLKPGDTIYQWLGGARLAAHRQMTITTLLNHTSGLPAWHPYYRELPISLIGTDGGKHLILDACFHEEPITPPGETTLYSDIGYILLGKILEEAGGAPLDVLFLNRIARPLNLSDTFFRRIIGAPQTLTARRTTTTANQHIPTPRGRGAQGDVPKSPADHRRFAPTEDCPWRERVVHGEVHDQNAYALGGVAGHAGLFSTATDIHQFLVQFIDCLFQTTSWIPQATIKQFIDEKLFEARNGERYVGGWNLPSIRNSAAGRHFSKHSIGHLAYTGCSIWVDLDRHAWVILLTNRIHPSSTNEKIQSFRPKIHDLAMTQLIL